MGSFGRRALLSQTARAIATTMSDSLRYDNRVAIVTGAGGGLGRAYALLLASRGAKVVVNDLGTTTTGEGATSRAADKVVEEIRKAGGQAVANYDSVEDGEKIVKTAIDAWGRVDIVINNAGILRDVSFIKMKDSDWDLVYRVHLRGAYSVTKAAWPHMKNQNYGRIVMTASAAGLYGNFGQANYSAMKLALLGFGNSLALEGAKSNIKVNTIAPVAGTRMTATIMPPELVEALKPEFVAPLVAYLVHETCEANGSVFEVGAGWVAKLRWERAAGKYFGQGLTPEALRDQWGAVTDFGKATHPATIQEATAAIMEGLQRAKDQPAEPKKPRGGGNAAIDLARVVGYQFAPSTTQYTAKEVALYALSVGAARNPLDEKELGLVYENAANFQALPTMGVIFPFSVLGQLMGVPGMTFNPMMLLHGEQYLELRKPLPTAATLTSQARIANVYDKGKGALVLIDAETKDEKGEVVVFNQFSLFIRGLGGFGGDRGPAGDANEPPNRPPDAVERDPTLPNQALWYRYTSGDLNPLHADPAMAAMGGFDRPILHGLCSFGHAGKAVLKHFCGYDTARFRSIRVRFSKHVFPGETLVTEMWRVSPTKVVFRCKVEERNEIVLSNSAVELNGPAGAASPAPAPAPAAASFKADAVFADLADRVKAAGPALVKQVGCVYHFHVTGGPAGAAKDYTVDLAQGDGAVREGKPANTTCSFTLSDEDLVLLFAGKLNSQQAFMSGKLKITGNMGAAMKLGQLVKQQAKL